MTYRQEGDFLLPNLKAPESPKIGKYGMLRFRYLRDSKKATFSGMQMAGSLNSHVEKIDQEATEMVESLVSQMAKDQGVNEQLKKSDQMKWVQMMNNIKASAEEIVMKELIYS
ncbi:MAG: TnpV protein [Clostridiales bacterium]|nr:TnpV protein [Clostridiales bacterium]